ncbi:MAG: polysaccharide deacetylase family protein [Ginsengibacter sp.]
MKKLWPVFIVIILFAACTSSTDETKNKNKSSEKNIEDTNKLPFADVATILSKKEVPVLCYHHIKPFSHGGRLMGYEVCPEGFAAQMKALADSGYKTILPDDLYEYLVHGASLPEKPVMLTFDDNDKEQFTIGETEMKKYGFKGVYFIMTISINRSRYMSEADLKQLSDSGHAVEGHTWDHHMVTKYTSATWDTQLVKPQKRLEAITGKPIKYFAYPFGLWNQPAIPELKSHGYKMAFILSTERDSTEPLYTIRRMIVPGQWTPQGMIKAMNQTFHLRK